MRKLLVALGGLFLCLTANAQNVAIGSLTAQGADCSTAGACISLQFDSNDVGSASIQLSGAFTATVQFEASSDKGTTWVAISGTPLNSTTAVTSATTANTWKFNVASITNIRARASAWTSAPTVVIRSSKAVANAIGGGGGSGTPGGSNPQVQYNNAGAFGGVTGSSVSGANITWGGTSTATQFITSGTAAGCLTLNEAVASGSNTDVFCAPSGAFSNASFVLPAADGTSGQTLNTDGAGNLTLGAFGINATPLTTRGDLLIVNSTPALARLAIGTTGKYPKSNGTDVVYSTGAASGVGACPGSNWASTLTGDTAPTCTQPAFTDISGSATAAQMPSPLKNFELVNAQVGTTYTVASTDCGKLVTFNNGSAIAVTLPQATTTFAAPCQVYIRNLGAGVVTITPTTSTIDGLTSMGLPQFAEVTVISDSTNWQTYGSSISVKNAALSVNTLQVQPSIATAVVTEAVIGSDTNVGWTRKTKGTGSVTESPGSNSTSCYTVANATLTGILRVDCTNSRVGIGSAAPATTFDIKGLTQWNVNGLLTLYNNITTAGQGQAVVQCITSQKAETNAADTNVLTCTPASAVGTYRLHIVISVTSATSGVIGWTATWTDSNGNAQTPTNLALTQTGVAAPALTFTTSAAGNYHGEAIVDVNAAGTGIVIKWTGGGTSAAKVTATVERLI